MTKEEAVQIPAEEGWKKDAGAEDRCQSCLAGGARSPLRGSASGGPRGSLGASRPVWVQTATVLAATAGIWGAWATAGQGRAHCTRLP